MIKNFSLRDKLRLAFGVVSFLSISIATAGLLAFFSADIAQEARRTMRNKASLAMLELRWNEERSRHLAESLAADKAIQVLTDLGIEGKLGDYLEELARKEDSYAIFALGRDGKTLAASGRGGQRLLAGASGAPESEVLAASRAEGAAMAGFELSGGLLSLSAAAPMNRGREKVGWILVQRVLDGDKSLASEIAELIEGEAVLYRDGQAVASEGLPRLRSARYADLAEARAATFSQAELRRGGFLAEYRALASPSGAVIGYLGVAEGADSIVDSMRDTVLIGLAVLAAGMVLAFLLAERMTRSIVVPVSSLLEGVNRITSGDLSYEIMLDLRDEIGKLGESFNQMRLALREKIGTIEEINQGLEGAVEQRTKTIEELLNKMRKYLSPQLYDSIAGGTRDSDRRQHYRKKLTVFFSDVVSFTATTESMEAEELSDLLNGYLDAMAKVALKWGGTIDKFVGDAVMVFFGDPEVTSDKDHARRAVGMALEMRREIEALRGVWAAQGFDRPFSVRMGIATGYCTIGNFGSENKMDYTIIGSTVNLASRLQSASEPGSILVSHETFLLARDAYAFERAGELSLKGFAHTVECFRVIGPVEGTSAALDTGYVSLEGGRLTIRERSVEPASLPPDEKARLLESFEAAARVLRGGSLARLDAASGAWVLGKGCGEDGSDEGDAASDGASVPGPAEARPPEAEGGEGGGRAG